MYFAVYVICIYSDIQQQISSVRIYHAIEKGYTHHSGLSCLMVSLTPRAPLSEQATLTNGNIKLNIIQIFPLFGNRTFWICTIYIYIYTWWCIKIPTCIPAKANDRATSDLIHKIGAFVNYTKSLYTLQKPQHYGEEQYANRLHALLPTYYTNIQELGRL